MSDQSAAAQAASSSSTPSQSPSAKKIVVTAILGAAAEVLSTAYKVPEEEADMLIQGFRALINRIFGHH